MCKTCGRLVNFLWSKRHEKFFCNENAPEMVETTTGRRPSYLLSLAYSFVVRKISAALHTPTSKKSATVVRHRIERTIAGRPLVIEVTWVDEKRWRAHLVRIPGVPTAMMPFYGETPDDAATQLSDWLNRAHQHQADDRLRRLQSTVNRLP
jgi:hypothetical protein